MTAYQKWCLEHQAEKLNQIVAAIIKAEEAPTPVPVSSRQRAVEAFMQPISSARQEHIRAYGHFLSVRSLFVGTCACGHARTFLLSWNGRIRFTYTKRLK